MSTSKERINFSKIPFKTEYPDFLDIQLKSFREFFQLETNPEDRRTEGLFRVFSDNFPITDTRNQFVLEFLDYFVDPPRYTIQECIDRGVTYSVPLKAKLKLYCTDPEHEDFETIVQDVYLGTIPYMTPKGSFVINGAERVIVSQLHRSPGVFFSQSHHANGTKLYSARVIPFKGSWIEFATDINGVMYAYIDRKKKLPVTTLLRSIGYETDKDILEIFGLADEEKVSKAGLKRVVDYCDGWLLVDPQDDSLERAARELDALCAARGRNPDDISITVFATQAVDEALVERYAAAGVDRVIVWLPPGSTDVAMQVMDAAAPLIPRYA